MRFIPSEIAENDLVFLNLGFFPRFIHILNKNKPSHKFILLTHNSDRTFTDEDAALLAPYVNKIYAINSSSTNPLVTTIPLGFVDDKYKPHIMFARLATQHIPKEIFAYMNFTIQTNRVKRTECYNVFRNYSWITTEEALPPEEFYKKLAMSKYVISPEGTGIDCHRIYESIFLGAVPLLKTSKMDSYYEGLPVVIFKRWEDITQQTLQDTYDANKARLDAWVAANHEWYKAEFWLK